MKEKIMTILTEGGNVWPDVTPFTKDDAPRVVKKAQQLTPAGIPLIPIGSAGHKASSGDLDMMIDADAVMQYYGVNSEKEARAAMKADLISKGVSSALSGVNVHIKVPNRDSFAQVDIMLVKHAEDVSKFHQHDYSIEDTPYKGVHQQLLLTSLAKFFRSQQFPFGLFWSGFDGLYSRDEAGKKGEFVTRNKDEVAKLLLGPTANASTLGNVESMIAALPGGLSNPLAKQAIEDPKWPRQNEVRESVVTPTEWFRNMSNRLTEVSELYEEITPRELGSVEQFADSMWQKLGVDVMFTRHFLDRVNDERNGEPITVEDLIILFKKEYLAYGKAISDMRGNAEAVMKDLFTNVNLPFVMVDKGRSKQLVAKTVMRKRNFRSSGPEYKV
jgi:hypothetical protein